MRMMTTSKPAIGLIAGNGHFPFLFAKAARDQGKRVVAAAIKGDTSFFLKCVVDQINWFGPGELKRLFSYFQVHGIQEVIMAGQVNPDRLFDQNVQMDDEFRRLFAALQDRRADTIFAAVAEKLRENGIELLDSTIFLKDFLAPNGTLTRRGPTTSELDDIAFGADIAKSMGALDVGQTVVIKDRAIVAIEAMEGTDRCIDRGGKIAREGAVVVKVSKPKQDSRFDVPVIGPKTILTMKRCRASCLAVESGKTLIIDQSKCVRLANKSRITLVGI